MTIEERAREYAKGRKYEIVAYVAYIAGAIGQKDIDIENACKACDNELRRLKRYSTRVQVIHQTSYQ